MLKNFNNIKVPSSWSLRESLHFLNDFIASSYFRADLMDLLGIKSKSAFSRKMSQGKWDLKEIYQVFERQRCVIRFSLSIAKRYRGSFYGNPFPYEKIESEVSNLKFLVDFIKDNDITVDFLSERTGQVPTLLKCFQADNMRWSTLLRFITRMNAHLDISISRNEGWIGEDLGDGSISVVNHLRSRLYLQSTSAKVLGQMLPKANSDEEVQELFLFDPDEADTSL